MNRRSPLHDEHVRLGAKMVPFGGWEMPLQYESVLREHRAVREEAGLFDVSHLGKVTVYGPSATEFLDACLAGRVSTLTDGRAGYNLLLNVDGGIIDDLFVYNTGGRYILIPNAGNTDTVLNILSDKAAPGVTIIDSRGDWAIIALSGPAARKITKERVDGAADLKMHRVGDARVADVSVLASRTGYTGEYTVELLTPSDQAGQVWRHLLSAGVSPAGLGARDTLRLEMGYPLHGHDITPDTDPISAGLDWVVDLTKDFVGARAVRRIRDTALTEKLVGLRSSTRQAPREGCQVFKDAKLAGRITSGNFSPTLSVGIGLAYVRTEVAAPGTMLTIDVRGTPLDAVVTQPPFVDKKA